MSIATTPAVTTDTTAGPSLDIEARRCAIAKRFQTVRDFTETLVAPLAPEDYVIQTMTEASPTKWHLAHTSWFFERFILQEHQSGYTPYREAYYYLFNSYYNTHGPQHCRNHRGLLSRPTVAEVYDYRRIINERLLQFLETCDNPTFDTIETLVFIGCQHEQQHQELIVTDIKHTLSSNPLLPAIEREGLERFSQKAMTPPSDADAGALQWVPMDEGIYEIGRPVPTGLDDWCFDNETPSHRVFLEAFELASRPTTNREYLQFIEDGGYKRHELWLSLGWAHINEHEHTHPIYWYQDEATNQWMQYTLHGPQPLDLDEPLCHVSYFEADAFARWAGARLPTEFEWEVAARPYADDLAAGHFSDSLELHPRKHSCLQKPETEKTGKSNPFVQLFGNIWEWTSSSYSPYPNFQTAPGALGEYNGKFMCNQYVLRGGSCATPAEHLRVTYRNFFPSESRWQYAGIRLARGKVKA